MYYGFISWELWDWVEDVLYEVWLKVVVCILSLDLGVDFCLVEIIIQIGSFKGVVWFMQCVGCSGYQFGVISKIYFVFIYVLEFIEVVVLCWAIVNGELESCLFYIWFFDVLVQYLVILAVFEGFCLVEILLEVRGIFVYVSIIDEEWAWCLAYICLGGQAL